MSIPWILTENVGVKSTQSFDTSHHVEKLLFTLDVYNDASTVALHRLSKRHLYNEMLAEANLVLDQFVFLMSDKIYMYYKNISAVSLIEKNFRGKLK